MSAKRSQAQSIGSPTSSTGNGEGNSNGSDQHLDKKFKVVHGDGDGDDDEDDEDDEDAPKSGKRAGRRKIKIEYIEDKSRRHITFSKRKSGIMKKVICKQGYLLSFFFAGVIQERSRRGTAALIHEIADSFSKWR